MKSCFSIIRKQSALLEEKRNKLNEKLEKREKREKRKKKKKDKNKNLIDNFYIESGSSSSRYLILYLYSLDYLKIKVFQYSLKCYYNQIE